MSRNWAGRGWPIAVIAALAMSGLVLSKHFKSDASLPDKSEKLSEVDLRPKGIVDVVSFDNGGVWKLMADNVSGKREARLAWVLEDYSADKSAPYHDAKTLYKLNCETKQYVRVKTVAYDKHGAIWGNPPRLPEGEAYIVPGSNMSLVADAACQPGFDIQK